MNESERTSLISDIAKYTGANIPEWIKTNDIDWLYSVRNLVSAGFLTFHGDNMKISAYKDDILDRDMGHDFLVVFGKRLY